MSAVVIFHDEEVDNTTEIHAFEHDKVALRFSRANRDRPHTIIRVPGERWHTEKLIDPPHAPTRR
jgi:hypothetical protein